MIEGKTAVKQAEAQTKMKIATGELDWDLAAMKATENSWKDEWITLFVQYSPYFGVLWGLG